MVFHKSPYISIFAPTKNLLPLTDLSVSEKREKKKGGKTSKKLGNPIPKGPPQGGLPDDFVFFRLFEPGSERRKGWGFGGGYGDDLGMVYYVYIYIYIYRVYQSHSSWKI